MTWIWMVQGIMVKYGIMVPLLVEDDALARQHGPQSPVRFLIPSLLPVHSPPHPGSRPSVPAFADLLPCALASHAWILPAIVLKARAEGS